jgi:DNA-binding Xre family transcriptional regulator
MISYEPLKKSLKELNRNLNEMRLKGNLNSRTIARINRNESVNLSTIESICLYFDLPIEKVVKITRE